MISLLDSLISLEKIGSLKELVQRIAITIKTWLKLELPSSKISSYLVRDGDTDHYAMIFLKGCVVLYLIVSRRTVTTVQS